MKFFKYVYEDYVTTGKGLEYGGSSKHVLFPIYKNPGNSDYKEIRKADDYLKDDGVLLRTIIDVKNQNIFVWNALHGVHIEGFYALRKSGDIKVEKDSITNLFFGAPRLRSSNKLTDENALSFIVYARYYNICSTIRDKDIAIKNIESKCQWLKKYYAGKVTVDIYNGDPTIIMV